MMQLTATWLGRMLLIWGIYLSSIIKAAFKTLNLTISSKRLANRWIVWVVMSLRIRWSRISEVPMATVKWTHIVRDYLMWTQVPKRGKEWRNKGGPRLMGRYHQSMRETEEASFSIVMANRFDKRVQIRRLVSDIESCTQKGKFHQLT